MNISGAMIDGTPNIGANVKVEGYFDANGVFVVTKVEVESSDASGSGDSASVNDNQDNGSNDSGSHDDNGERYSPGG